MCAGMWTWLHRCVYRYASRCILIYRCVRRYRCIYRCIYMHVLKTQKKTGCRCWRRVPRVRQVEVGGGQGVRQQGHEGCADGPLRHPGRRQELHQLGGKGGPSEGHGGARRQRSWTFCGSISRGPTRHQPPWRRPRRGSKLVVCIYM